MNTINNGFRYHKYIKQYYRFLCLFVFAILYFNESMMFKVKFSATFRCLLTLTATGIIWFVNMLYGKRIITLSRTRTLCYIVLFSCIVFSCSINGFDLTFDGYTLIILTIAFAVSTIIEIKLFEMAYVDVMVFLSIISIVLFLGYLIVPSLFNVFPNVYWKSEVSYLKNCFLCVLPVNSQYYRNNGIFYEPGMYSVFLIWAIIIEAFHNNCGLVRIAVLFVALLTTFSTNGYMCGFLLMIALLLNSMRFSKATKRKMIIIIFGICCFVCVYMSVNTLAYNFLVGKFNEIVFFKSVDNQTRGSGYERWRSIVYAFEAIEENPIVGIARTGWQKKFSSIISTATPLNWFGIYGIVYGNIMNLLYLKMGSAMKRIEKNRLIIFLVLAIVLVINIMSQNMAADIVMFIIVFYQAIPKERMKAF